MKMLIVHVIPDEKRHGDDPYIFTSKGKSSKRNN